MMLQINFGCNRLAGSLVAEIFMFESVNTHTDRTPNRLPSYKITLSPLFSIVIDPIILKLECTEDMHKIWTSSNFGTSGPRTTELYAIESLEKTPITLEWELWCLHFFSVVFHPILFIITVNEDMHKSQTSWNIGHIRQSTAELAALECAKNPHRLTMGNTLSSLFLGCL